MRLIPLTAIFLGALAFTLAGCNDPLKTPPGGPVDPLPAGAYPRNVATDGLVQGLFFGEAKVTPPTADTPMRVVQPVRATEDYSLHVQYWFEWLDESGRPLRTSNSESWRFKSLTPRVETLLDANAPDTHAVDWRLHVRSAR